MMKKTKINIPLSVPRNKEIEYKNNWKKATWGTGNLMMFAGDQKVEHLNDDFVGKGIPKEVADPEHYFRIANKAKIGVFATQLGLLSKYGRDYPNINYLVKVNSKANILKKTTRDPFSGIWIQLKEILEFKKQSKANIVGVGYTVYLGSWYESEMFKEAAHLICEAHKAGLIVVIWMYPRGVSVINEKDVHLIAGAAGVATCLGADFVKLNYPNGDKAKSAEKFKEVVNAAGDRTGVICVGGSKKDPRKFLKSIYDQKHISKTRGVAIGRNIYQNTLEDSIRMANAISSIAIFDYSLDDAFKILKDEKELNLNQ